MTYSQRRTADQLSIGLSKLLSLRNLIIGIVFLFIVVIIFPISTVLMLQTTYAKHIAESSDQVKEVSVIVVMSDAVYSESTDAMEERLNVANEVANTTSGARVLVSGSDELANLADERQPELKNLIVDRNSNDTYDTCYRLRYVYQFDEVTIVSHRKHLERALYTCASMGIEVRGVVVDSPNYSEDWVQELIAFNEALWEINILKPDVDLSE